MNRLRARVFSVLAALAFAACAVAPARAQNAALSSFWFAGTRLIFERAVPLDGDVAVSIRDAGLLRFLARLGATVSYQPQQRYVVVTASDRRTVTFTLGSADFTAGGVAGRATLFRPVPSTARHPDRPAVRAGPRALRRAGRRRPARRSCNRRSARLTFAPRAGAARCGHPRRDRTRVRQARRYPDPRRAGVRRHRIGARAERAKSATASRPRLRPADPPRKTSATIVALDAPRGLVYDIATPASPYELALSVSAATASAAAPVAVRACDAGAARDAGPDRPRAVLATPRPLPALSAVALPAPQALPLPAGATPSADAVGHARPARCNAAPLRRSRRTSRRSRSRRSTDGLTIRLQLDGAAAYDWHRLADLRWYVDIHGAPADRRGPRRAPVRSPRSRACASAKSGTPRRSHGARRVDVARAQGRRRDGPTPTGLTISATNVDAIVLARTGHRPGRLGRDRRPPTVDAPRRSRRIRRPGGLPLRPWPVPPARVIIVLDPGHGGDDFGTAHNGLVEKYITIDVAPPPARAARRGRLDGPHDAR